MPETDALVIPLRGELTHRNRQTFKAATLDRIASGARHLVIDLAECGYIDSSGLGVLLSLDRRVRSEGGSLRLRHPNEDLRALLELTKLDTVLTVEEVAA